MQSKGSPLECEECKGKTLLVWSNGVRTEVWLCSHWAEPGHLSKEQVEEDFKEIDRVVKERLKARFG